MIGRPIERAKVANGGAGVGVENRIDADVAAYIEGSGSTGIIADSVRVKAMDTSVIATAAGSASLAASFGFVGFSVSIGTATAYNEVGTSVRAYIDQATVTSRALGDITVAADSSATITRSASP